MNISTRSLGSRRKNSEMSEETRQKIVEAAENVFCEKGVCNSTIEDIALMAGMTRGAVYWHFRDKHEILLAVLKSVRFPIEDISPGQSFEDSCNRIKTAFLETIKIPHALRVAKILLHTSDLTDNQSPVHLRLSSIRLHLKTYFEQVLKSAMLNGELPKDIDEKELHALAVTLRAVITGLLFELMLELDEKTLASEIDLSLTSFFKLIQLNTGK
jgi:TetR/AcrR family acrAB operon transcriptional repressor